MPQPITAALLLLTHEKHREKLWLHFLPALTYHMQEGNLVWIKAFGFAQSYVPMSFKKLAASVLIYQLACCCCCCWFFFRICSSQRVESDLCNSRSPALSCQLWKPKTIQSLAPWTGASQFLPSHKKIFTQHSTAQHSTEDWLEVPFHWQKKGLPN